MIGMHIIVQLNHLIQRIERCVTKLYTFHNLYTRWHTKSKIDELMVQYRHEVIHVPLKSGNTRVVISMPEELRKTLEQEAEQEDRSLSNYLLQIIKQRHKIKNT